MNKGQCVLYDRECIDCGECEFCDLDPTKVCDNCGKCLDIRDYAAFRIDNFCGVELTEKPAGASEAPALKGKMKANKSLKTESGKLRKS